MKLRSILGESAAILAIGLVLGTVAHLAWPYAKPQQIGWTGNWSDCLLISKEQPKAPVAPPAGPTPPASPAKGTPGYPPALVDAGGKKAGPELPPSPSAPVRVDPPEESIREIALEDAKAEFDAQTVFIDARRSSLFKEGHVRGARSIPIAEDVLAEEQIGALLQNKDLSLGDPIVIYCTGGNCEDSHQLADRLKLAGFKNLRIMKEGINAWRESKLPMEEGEGSAEVGGQKR